MYCCPQGEYLEREHGQTPDVIDRGEREHAIWWLETGDTYVFQCTRLSECFAPLTSMFEWLEKKVYETEVALKSPDIKIPKHRISFQ